MNSGQYRPRYRVLAAPVAVFSSCLVVTGTALADQSPSGQAGTTTDTPATTAPANSSTPATTLSDDNEIVVTALRRSTSIQQTPLAISAVSEQTLTNMGITDSDQLARATPDLVFRESANGGSRIIIRNIQAAGEPTVGLYYDETPIIGSVGVSNDAGGTTPTVRLFDIERAEVLRGPQGTLYGSSSEAGTVRLIFNKPNLAQYEGAAEAQATDIDGGSGGNEERGMVNLPLVDGVLGARLVGFHDHTGGWLENTRLNLHNFNDTDSNGGRILVRYKPLQNITLDLLGVIQDTVGWNNDWNYRSFAQQGGAPFNQNLATLQPNRDKLRLYSATLNWDFGPVNLTAVTSYSDRQLTATFDYSPYFANAAATATAASGGCKIFATTGGANCNPAQLSAYQAFATSLSVISAYQPQDTRNITEELRLAGTQGPLKWTVGAYGAQRNTDILSQLNTGDPFTGAMYTPPSPVPITLGSSTRPATTAYQRTIEDVLDQVAGFAELTYDVTDKLDVTAGTRRFNYKKAVTGAVQIGNPVLNVAVQPPVTARDSESGEVSKFGVDYNWTDNLMTYASASQGFRPGGVNQVIGLPSALGPYKSDSLWDYELGVKSAWLDRKLVVNADIFQIDWTNIQTSAQTTTSQANGSTFSFITNAGNVRVRGVELETNYRPITGLVLTASGSFAAARLRGNETAPGGITITGAGVNGDYVPFTPKVTAQASAQYTLPISSKLELLSRIDSNYIGDSWTVFHRTNAYQQELPGYATEDLRLGVQSADDKWGTYFFINNLTNKIGFITKSIGASVGPAPAETVLSTMPRTFGVDGRYRF
jgi:iron complex outermembrane recepter protein